MFRVLCFVLFCGVLALADRPTTAVSQCVFHSGQLPLHTYIDGCTTQPCQLEQGRYAVVNIIFQAPRTMHQMRTAATAFLPLIPIPVFYDLGEDAYTCNSLSNTYCPVLQSEVIKYTLHMLIEEFMPVGIQLPIEFRILDDSGTAILCVRSQVRITAPQSKFGAQNETMTIKV